ncbi:hypothetical protein AA103196_1931 [Ameyamaea chiangmaiensis NBRC 103196]|uniref:Lipoprotein n=1 Tax=Ameyamaea chiangmaiensis TaxID=442969 RepID=A0A850P932_9PROT|nr:hypothetical protein [Ameyamaea chiangmaiensis]MBS4073805.1 hypothetical protein [Ameyamaea chiangmaiensis]NVN39199.1 hypothetical protein [Ameyamaea chiangmaiensis]GBQ68368.1 hypothetical protein AA103196_1931 [Ameyamaea chiangmaiensis NBRC 103196]
MSFRVRRIALSGMVCVVLSGCGYQDSRVAHHAQFSMIGMSVNDLQACAGIPEKTATLNPHTKLMQYSYKPSATGSFSISPLNLATVSFGGTGALCQMMVRVVDDQVTEVHYTGDDDEMIGTDGVCSSVVRGCVRQPESTSAKVKGGLFGPVSAFHSPAIPAQSANSVYNLPLKGDAAAGAPAAAVAATAH